MPKGHLKKVTQESMRLKMKTVWIQLLAGGVKAGDYEAGLGFQVMRLEM